MLKAVDFFDQLIKTPGPFFQYGQADKDQWRKIITRIKESVKPQIELSESTQRAVSHLLEIMSFDLESRIRTANLVVAYILEEEALRERTKEILSSTLLANHRPS